MLDGGNRDKLAAAILLLPKILPEAVPWEGSDRSCLVRMARAILEDRVGIDTAVVAEQYHCRKEALKSLHLVHNRRAIRRLHVAMVGLCRSMQESRRGHGQHVTVIRSVNLWIRISTSKYMDVHTYSTKDQDT